MNATPDILTIDVEEWFHGHNYLDQAPTDTWEGRASRVVGNTERCLELLAKHKVTGTFFVLGWTAERHPDLIRRIAGAGHEIACHSYAHPVVHQLTPEEFRADLRRARAALAAADADHYDRTLCYWRGGAVSSQAEIVVALNFDHNDHTWPVAFPVNGTWHRYHPENGAWEAVEITGNQLVFAQPASSGALWRKADGSTGVPE